MSPFSSVYHLATVPLRLVLHSLSQSFLRRPRLGQTSLVVTYPFACIYLITFVLTCAAQTTINGQIYTNGLSIINAPAQRSEYHAGGNLPISIEVSGNGKLPFAALNPGSGLASSYELLEIYLVSSQAQLNLTVSSGTDLLTRESGTVRHQDFSIPSCVPSGQYNLTFYEISFINSIPCFVITPIPISILNNADSTCINEGNNVQAQPQPSSDYGQLPFDPKQHLMVSTGAIIMGAAATRTSDSGSHTPDASLATGPSPSDVNSPTAQSDGSPKPSGSVTLVIVSQVIATTSDGQGKPITTRYMTTRTTTVPMSTQDSTGFIPINAGVTRFDHFTYALVPNLICFLVVILNMGLD